MQSALSNGFLVAGLRCGAILWFADIRVAFRSGHILVAVMWCWYQSTECFLWYYGWFTGNQPSFV